MIHENEQNKKLLYQMFQINQELQDEFMDMKLLNIEMKQKLQILESKI